jgi:hypothetical protein
MSRRMWIIAALLLALPLIAGAAYGSAALLGYVCPVTGEILRCPLCCEYE